MSSPKSGTSTELNAPFPRLRQLAPPTALVLRNGQPKEVETAFLVPGDILLLKVGQRVPADARLLEAYGLEVDESSLTGESFPAAKDATAVLPSETRITDQTNMVFTGTVITRGRAKALVTATGVNTELGRVAGITKAAKEPKTALQLAMKQLSKTLVWVALFFAILIPVLSYVRGLQPSPAEAVLYGLSLAFVVIPEELPNNNHDGFGRWQLRFIPEGRHREAFASSRNPWEP